MKKRFYCTISALFALIVLAMLAAPFAASADSYTYNMKPAGIANLRVVDLSLYNVPQDSNHNYVYSSLNWSKIKQNVDAVYIRATYRSNTDPNNLVNKTDACYQSLANAAQSAGISHGFYHFMRPSASEAINRQQADFFYEAIKRYGYDCVPMLDIEESEGLNKAQITAAVKQFADEFKSKCGGDIMIYTYNSFIDSYLDKSLSGYRLWVANISHNPSYTSSSTFKSTWSSYDMWQYTWTLSVPGIPGTVDGDWGTRNILLNSVSGITQLDYPKGTYGAGNIQVSGWAISYYGISRLDVYVDGKCLGGVSGDSLSARGDVEGKFGGAGYDNALDSGYSFTIPDGKLLSGTHTITVAAINQRGKAIWSQQKSFVVNAPENKLGIERPTATSYKGDIMVSGWAISRFGIGRTDIYVDNKFAGSVANQSMTGRSDIKTQYAGSAYIDLDHSGYSFKLQSMLLAGGSHTVRVASIDSKGRVTWSAARTFYVTAPQNRISLDSTSGTYTGNVPVYGWAISHFGVKRVDVYIDGKGFASLSSAGFSSRTDIAKLFANQGYNDFEHSGFSYSIPVGKLASGSHTIRVAMIDNSGKVLWAPTKSFTVSLPQNRMSLDRPSGTYTGDVPVSGWALSYFGVKRVDVYVDGKGLVSLSSAGFTNRTDIAKLFANQGYNDFEHTGFSYSIPAGTLTAGSHTIRAAMIDNSGKVLWSQTKSFTLN